MEMLIGWDNLSFSFDLSKKLFSKVVILQTFVTRVYNVIMVYMEVSTMVYTLKMCILKRFVRQKVTTIKFNLIKKVKKYNFLKYFHKQLQCETTRKKTFYTSNFFK